MFPGALRRDILALLAVKAVFLMALYLLFFSHPHGATSGSLMAHILGR